MAASSESGDTGEMHEGNQVRGDKDGELRNTQMLTSDPLISGCLGHMTARREGVLRLFPLFSEMSAEPVRLISSNEVKLHFSSSLGSHQQEQLWNGRITRPGWSFSLKMKKTPF